MAAEGVVGAAAEAGSVFGDFSTSAISLLVNLVNETLGTAVRPRGKVDAQRVNEVGGRKKGFKVLIRYCDSHT